MECGISAVDCCEWPANHIIMGTENGSLIFADSGSGEQASLMRSHCPVQDSCGAGGVKCLAFDHTGGVLATGGNDGSLRVWDHCLGIEVTLTFVTFNFS